MHRTFIAGGAGLIMGAALGFWATRHHFERTRASDAALTSAAGIARDLATLECFNNGDTTQAVRLLHSHLTVETIFLARRLGELPLDQRDTNLVRTLDRAYAFQSNQFVEPSSIRRP